MLDHSQGKMFLSAERGHTETDWFRSYNTFHFGNYRREHKSPFGALYVFNDDTLAGGRHTGLLVEQPSVIIVLPTVGGVLYKDSQGHENFIEAGKALVYATPAGTTIEFHNPYEDELINFLHLWINISGPTGAEPLISAFNLDAGKNQLQEIPTGSNELQCMIGKFAGRQEILYPISRQNHGLFAFVLEGAFELQYRLLETRDGLALWNIQQAELEALSNDAIILLAEIPLSEP